MIWGLSIRIGNDDSAGRIGKRESVTGAANSDTIYQLDLRVERGAFFGIKQIASLNAHESANSGWGGGLGDIYD